MDFRIAGTFTDSLARLTGEEQKAVETTAFAPQLNPFDPGMQFHELDKAMDQRSWSVRVRADIRLIFHRTDADLLLCYIAHHSDAHRRAERGELAAHLESGRIAAEAINHLANEVLKSLRIQ